MLTFFRMICHRTTASLMAPSLTNSAGVAPAGNFFLIGLFNRLALRSILPSSDLRGPLTLRKPRFPFAPSATKSRRGISLAPPLLEGGGGVVLAPVGGVIARPWLLERNPPMMDRFRSMLAGAGAGAGLPLRINLWTGRFPSPSWPTSRLPGSDTPANFFLLAIGEVAAVDKVINLLSRTAFRHSDVDSPPLAPFRLFSLPKPPLRDFSLAESPLPPPPLLLASE